MNLSLQSTLFVSPSAVIAVPQVQSIAPRRDATGLSRSDTRNEMPTPIRVSAMLLLAGSERNELTAAIGRSRLDLPLDKKGTVLTHWQQRCSEWFSQDPPGPCPVRIIVDQSSPAPYSSSSNDSTPFCIERDPHDCRGTGGLLRDLAADYEDDQWILVATGAQVLLEPLGALVNQLREMNGDVRFMAHADGTSVGLMLIRCGCLRSIERIGFVDFKEQCLSRIARSHKVSFLVQKQPTGMPVTTLLDYIRAIRWHHLRSGGHARRLDAFAEDWQCLFRSVEPGAQVDPTAQLHDSVILGGARVERDATVVRSIVCPGAVVSRGQTVVDRLIRSRSR